MRVLTNRATLGHRFTQMNTERCTKPVFICAKLLIVGDARRQRRQVPVDMAVPLLAAQAEEVQALAGDRPPQRLGDAVDDPLQSSVLFQGKVAGHLLSVHERRAVQTPLRYAP
jgi:hypothetical protein